MDLPDDMSFEEMFSDTTSSYYKEVNRYAFEWFYLPMSWGLGFMAELSVREPAGYNIVVNLRVGPFEVGFFHWR
jgi:hypothetical protein